MLAFQEFTIKMLIESAGLPIAVRNVATLLAYPSLLSRTFSATYLFPAILALLANSIIGLSAPVSSSRSIS